MTVHHLVGVAILGLAAVLVIAFLHLLVRASMRAYRAIHRSVGKGVAPDA